MNHSSPLNIYRHKKPFLGGPFLRAPALLSPPVVGSHHVQGSWQRAKLGAAGRARLPNLETEI